MVVSGLEIVADAASIRTDAGSVGHGSYSCAGPYSPGFAGLIGACQPLAPFTLTLRL